MACGGCLPWAEQRAWLGMAWPISLVFMCRFLMDLTDLAFVGHLHHDPHFPEATAVDFLAAAGLALTWINLTSIPLWRGFCPALVTLASQAFYNDEPGLMQTFLQMALFFATLFCWALVGAWWYSGAVVQWALGDVCTDSCAALVTSYTRYSSLWLWPMVAFDQLEGLLQCRGEVAPAMVVNVVFVLVNVALNKVCVFGLDIPEWGVHIEGAGFIGSPIATAITRWSRTLVFFSYMALKNNFTAWTAGVALWSCSRALTYLRQCLAMAIGGCFEEWQVQAISLMAGRISIPAVAAHNGLLQVFLVLDSLMFGPMNATTVRIAHFLAQEDASAGKRVMLFAYFLTSFLAVAAAGTFMGLHQSIGRIFTDDAEVLGIVADIAPIAAGCYVLLCIGLTSLATLDAQCRPATMAAVFFCGGWLVALPLAWLLAFHFDLGLQGLWYGMVGGYGAIMLLSMVNVMRSDWDKLASQAVHRAGGHDDTFESDQPEAPTDPILTSAHL
eukprot:EG_transcript_9699